MVRGASMGPEDPLKTVKSGPEEPLNSTRGKRACTKSGQPWHKSLRMKQQKGETRMEAIGEEDEAERRQHDLGSAK